MIWFIKQNMTCRFHSFFIWKNFFTFFFCVMCALCITLYWERRYSCVRKFYSFYFFAQKGSYNFIHDILLRCIHVYFTSQRLTFRFRFFFSLFFGLFSFGIFYAKQLDVIDCYTKSIYFSLIKFSNKLYRWQMWTFLWYNHNQNMVIFMFDVLTIGGSSHP